LTCLIREEKKKKKKKKKKKNKKKKKKKKKEKNSIFGSVWFVFKELKLQEFCHKEMDAEMIPVNAALCASLKGA
jgi:hypothetical protein